MTFLKKINFIIDEALISKKEIKNNPEMIETLTDSFDFNKYKGVRKNILRPLFKKIANAYNVPLYNHGKTLIFDFQNLMIEKDITSSRQLATSEKILLSNLLFRYNYIFDENLFYVGNAKKRNGHLESLINIFDKIQEEIKDYQKIQNEKDKNIIKEKKIKADLEKIKTDNKFLIKTNEEKEKIKKSKEELIEKLNDKNLILNEKLENLRKDEEAFTKLQDKVYKYKDINYKILLTYIPWRVAAMSTFSNSNAPWTSCMNLETGSNSHYVGSSISNGAFVAYLIRPGDESNIENPIARVLIKPFIKIQENDIDDDYEMEDDETEEEFEERIDREKINKYAEIDFIDKETLDTNVFWYVDLVYPRGQYGVFRSKVVSIFNKVNANVKKGKFAISKGQYADSKSMVEIDDIFKYVNDGDYSDIKEKDNNFITKMLKNYPFEFFSNWPENEPMPSNIKINSTLELENMDIRKIPEGLNIDGDLKINNLNISKISKVKCKKMILKNNNNLIKIENCNLETLVVENNKKLNNVDNNNKYDILEIIKCKKINKLENLNLKSLKIEKNDINENFIFGKNLKIREELNLKNFKIDIKNLSIFKEIKILQLRNISLNELSGNYESVFIHSGCEIETIRNLNVKYNLQIDSSAKVKKLLNIKIESTLSLYGENIEIIKNLEMTQKYESPTSRYVGCSINCVNLKEIENISAEHYLSIANLKDIKIINNLSCDGDITIQYSNLMNFNNLNNFKINCKKFIFELSKIKSIKNIKIDELNIIEAQIEEISNIECKKEFEITKSNINSISDIKVENKIFISNSKIKKIENLKAKDIYFNKFFSEMVLDFNDETIEKISMIEAKINEIKNLKIDSLGATNYSYIGKLENVKVKKELKISNTGFTEIGKNVIFGSQETKNTFRISFIDTDKVSRDFKIYGDAILFNNDFEVLPYMTIKGKLSVTSDSMKDVTEDAEIDQLEIHGDRYIMRDDLDKEKILKKIKTLSKV